MRKFFLLLIVLAIITASFFAGVFFAGNNQNQQEEIIEDSRTSLSWGYTFINPLLECEVNTLGAHQRYIPFEKETKDKLETEVQDKNPDIHLSVYFRNLNNGPWFGISEDAGFSPASLMKLPILIMYLKWAEFFPEILEKKITVQTPSEINQIIKPTKQLELGKEYSITDALYYTIVYSDNTAVETLLSIIPVEIQERILGDLGIPSIQKSLAEQRDYVLSVREYASFFRILYNASYLERSFSENALDLLSQTTFNEGIRANIPKNIAVAHKFGEREIMQKDGTMLHQLHDCGIVYQPNYPYLLCVMTRGSTDYDKLKEVIQQTSNIIYTEVSKKFPAQ